MNKERELPDSYLIWIYMQDLTTTEIPVLICWMIYVRNYTLLAWVLLMVEWECLSTGVPQCLLKVSIFSPILFSVYIISLSPIICSSCFVFLSLLCKWYPAFHSSLLLSSYLASSLPSWKSPHTGLLVLCLLSNVPFTSTTRKVVTKSSYAQPCAIIYLIEIWQRPIIRACFLFAVYFKWFFITFQ